MHARCRKAFTLTELLVSAALIMFVMLLLASCFQTGLGAMSGLKAAASLGEQLRAASTIIRRDLSLSHFDDADGPLLSDQRLDQLSWTPPKRGYFRIWQGSPSVYEGADGDGLPSYQAQDHWMSFTVRQAGAGRDSVFVTDNIPALNNFIKPNFLAIDGLFASPWAEVAYFLRANEQFTNEGRRVYTLYRRQRLLVDADPRGTLTVSGTAVTSIPLPTLAVGDPTTRDLSVYMPPGANALTPNTPTDVTVPMRRLGMLQRRTGFNAADVPGLPPTRLQITSTPRYTLPAMTDLPTSFTNEAGQAYGVVGDTVNAGDDVLMNNVLSFEIKAIWDTLGVPTTTPATFPALEVIPYATPSGLAAAVPATSSQYANNLDAPFANLPRPAVQARRNRGLPGYADNNTVRVFDTWCGKDLRTTVANDPNNFFAPVAQAKQGAIPERLDTEAGSDPRRCNWNHGYFNPVPNTTVAELTATADVRTIPVRIRIRALQIRLRVWDIKSGTARQISIIQDV